MTTEWRGDCQYVDWRQLQLQTLLYSYIVTGLIAISRDWSHVRSRSESASVLNFPMPVPGLQVTTFGRNEQWSGPGSSARIHAGTRLNEDMNGFQVAILRGNMPQRLNMCTTKSIPKSYIRPQDASPQHTHTQSHNPLLFESPQKDAKQK